MAEIVEKANEFYEDQEEKRNEERKMSEISKGITKILVKVGSDLKEIDVNEDGVIDGKEVAQWVSKKSGDGTISEYFFLFIMVIMALVGYFKPGFNWAEWGAIFSIALILGNLLFTGVIKSRVQQKLLIKETENESLKLTNDALKQALVKATGKTYDIIKLENPNLR